MKPAFAAATAAAMTAFLAATADAGISNHLVKVEATNASGTGEFVIDLSAGIPAAPGVTAFAGGFGAQILDTNTSALVATITSLTGTYAEGDSNAINITFALIAGASDTTFTITSGLLDFATIDASNAAARTSASYASTDSGSGDGAFITAGLPGGFGYEAYLNGTPSTGTVFAQLLGDDSVAGLNSAGDDENFPETATGFSVSSASLTYSFTVGAGDQASGTTTYVIVPAPGVAGVLLAGGVLTGRRRR
ncbi:MAG: hypothetical protein AAGB51_10790 [Planctomycetota bacterium]